MQHRRPSRTLVVVVFATAVVASGSAAVRAASPTISGVSPSRGPVGTVVTITGSGFPGSGKSCTSTTVTFNDTASECTWVSSTSIESSVPKGATTGKLTVTTADGSAGGGKFTVTVPHITVLPSVGPPGATITVSGKGFTPMAMLDVFFDTKHTKTVTADSSGAFGAAAMRVPRSATPGQHWLTTIDPTTGAAGQRAFLVQTDWPQYRRSANHQANNTDENVIDPSNVSDLTEAWTESFGGDWTVDSSPAVADGVVYVMRRGRLYAFPESCRTGGGVCSPLWIGATGSRIDSSPSVADGVVYVGTSNQGLLAFPAACGAGGVTCMPLWSGGDGVRMTSPPTVANGVVYVGGFDGLLYAFRASCGTGGAVCSPLWTGDVGQAITSSPTVWNGVVYVGDRAGLFAFPASCGTGGATCPVRWRSDPGLGGFEASPAVADGVVFASGDATRGETPSSLAAFRASCGTGGAICSPLWTTDSGNHLVSSPAVADHVVYVALDWELDAFSVSCGTGGAICSPLWRGNLGDPSMGSSPAVANGVVYVGTDAIIHAGIVAFPASCGTGGVDCEPLWRATIGYGAGYSSPAVADGVVYIGGSDDRLHAYALPAGGRAPARPRPADLLDSSPGS